MDTSHAQVRLDHDARAIAISAIALVEGLIFLLTEKGVIDPSHPVEFFDEVLNALKQYSPDDPATGHARALVADFASRLARSFPQQR
jgi:hypothetical protein